MPFTLPDVEVQKVEMVGNYIEVLGPISLAFAGDCPSLRPCNIAATEDRGI